MKELIIANAVSMISAIFTILASWTKKPDRSYLYMVGQCLTYTIASIFFGVISTVIVMIINTIRNVLLWRNKYNLVTCIIFTILALVLGIIFNKNGAVGLITVAATVQYTICAYFLKKPIAVKLIIIINLTLWVIYDCFVFDVFSFVVDGIGIVVAIITIIRILRDIKKEKREETSL